MKKNYLLKLISTCIAMLALSCSQTDSETKDITLIDDPAGHSLGGLHGNTPFESKTVFYDESTDEVQFGICRPVRSICNRDTNPIIHRKMKLEAYLKRLADRNVYIERYSSGSIYSKPSISADFVLYEESFESLPDMIKWSEERGSVSAVEYYTQALERAKKIWAIRKFLNKGEALPKPIFGDSYVAYTLKETLHAYDDILYPFNFVEDLIETDVSYKRDVRSNIALQFVPKETGQNLDGSGRKNGLLRVATEDNLLVSSEWLKALIDSDERVGIWVEARATESMGDKFMFIDGENADENVDDLQQYVLCIAGEGGSHFPSKPK